MAKEKFAVQLDFDGTVTEEDVSFLLLDTFAAAPWRHFNDDYMAGKITVSEFNKKVFSLVKAGEITMTDFVLTDPRVKVRSGFKEFLSYCRKNSFEVVVVSNGLRFYIEAIFRKIGIRGLEIYASENEFFPGGVKVRYLGPDGREVAAGFKEAYTDTLHKMGYQVVYVGDGSSDVRPSKKANYVCATGSLLEKYRSENLKCHTFTDFFDVIKVLKDIVPKPSV